MRLKDWVASRKLKASITGNILTLNDKKYYILSKKPLTPQFTLNVPEQVLDRIQTKQLAVDFWLFFFGDCWYYCKIDDIDSPSLNIFSDIGECKSKAVLNLPYLGIHGRYELMNGSRKYRDWVKRAIFLQYRSLGICEKNTLAGIPAFQIACEKKDIKPIIGCTLSIYFGSIVHDIKVYVKNKQGWISLLRLHKIINVDKKILSLSDLLREHEGLICVINPQVPSEYYQPLKENYQSDLYIQIDLVKWRSQDRDKAHLLDIQNYIQNYLKEIPAVLIHDSYYLNKSDSHVKVALNLAGKVKFQFQSKDQFFKSPKELALQLLQLFDDKNKAARLLKWMAKNTREIEAKCNFKLDLESFHLPKYEMSEIESKYFDSNEKLFNYLIKKGFRKKLKNKKNKATYINRLKEELRIIKLGGFVDYFLILHDLIRWASENKILTGIGRGSAGGCLISYLLDIIKLDPLEYGLLFERFLNEGRIGGSLPDIDTDFEGRRRGEVKRYMEQKYGEDYVCSVGTYGTLQVRAAIQELARVKGIHHKETSYITKMIDFSGDGDFEDIFRNASEKEKLKEYVQKHSDVISDVQRCFGNPKNTSIHACATLIVPKEDNEGNPRTIYEWLPLRKVDDGTLVSEWEGEYTEAVGFLKEDILGIRQLDKFRLIFDLVEKSTGETLSLENIPLNEKGVYKLFQKGHTEDNFHFGTQNLQGYCKEVKPESISDLIAIIALYRPGAMKSNAHKDYVAYKFGKKRPTYDYMLKSVTRETYGLYIYQEQVMEACRVLGGFTLTEADGVRKAMGKKIKEKMDGYKVMFMEGAAKNGCSEQEALAIWNKLEVFSGYGFNKSHAAAYAITGYISQWLKYKYPTQYWVAAFQYAGDSDISRYIAEINNSDLGITLAPPNVNYSRKSFYADFETNTIYWSLTNVRFIGESAADAIMEVRGNEEFFSLDDFVEKVPSRKVKKNGVINLILAGALDDFADKTRANEIGVHFRYILLSDYYELRGERMPESSEEYAWREDWWWTLKQKSLCGLGYLNYRALCKQHEEARTLIGLYTDSRDMLTEGCLDQNALIVGIVESCTSRSSRRGPFLQILLNSNDENIYVTVWNETYNAYKDRLKEIQGRIVFVTGIIKFDGWKKCNVLHTTSKSVIYLL